LAGVSFALVALGCASSSAFRLGQKAEQRQDFDRAVLEYSRAVKQHPENAPYRAALERTRLRAALQHQLQGRRLYARGQYKEAVDELRLAYDLNPSAEGLQSDLRDAEERRQSGQRERTLAEIKELARERPLSGLQLGPGAKEPLGLSFRGTSCARRTRRSAASGA
jgi:tetratricopeptide (TPR) repeat protein